MQVIEFVPRENQPLCLPDGFAANQFVLAFLRNILCKRMRSDYERKEFGKSQKVFLAFMLVIN